MESTCDVHLHRQCVIDSWGFSMAGGIEQHRPLSITKVFRSTPAEGKLEEGEVIIKINEKATNKLFHREAVNLIQRSGPYLKLTISRAYMGTFARNVPAALEHQGEETHPDPSTGKSTGRSITPQAQQGVFRTASVPRSSSLSRALAGYRPPPSYFFSTPDVAIAGTPEAATRTVEINLARHKPVAPFSPKARDFNKAAQRFYKEAGDFGARMMVKY